MVAVVIIAIVILLVGIIATALITKNVAITNYKRARK